MAYNSNTNERNLVSKLVVTGVKSIVNSKSQWVGTMSDLNLAIVSKLGSKVPSNWPASPSALRIVLNRVIRRVRAEGISVRFSRSRDRLVEFSSR